MTSKSPKVIFNQRSQLALNNPDRKNHNSIKIVKAVKGMFDYYSNEEKRVMNMFDYYTGKINKHDNMNLILENGKYATEKDIIKRKKDYSKYIENSNLWRGVISFNNDYINQNITIEKLQQELIKDVIPKFLKRCGFVDIRKMSYQLSLHTDTDNLHFHFSFMEKEPNYQYKTKIGYKRMGMINLEEINYLKNYVAHIGEKENINTPLHVKTNKEIESLKKYFNPKEKNYLLYDKNNLIIEENILRLGKLLYENKYGNNSKIKFNSIYNSEIESLTKNIKSIIIFIKSVRIII
ncbi:MAG: relaxase MobL [Bacilli bacterium]